MKTIAANKFRFFAFIKTFLYQFPQPFTVLNLICSFDAIFIHLDEKHLSRMCVYLGKFQIWQKKNEDCIYLNTCHATLKYS